MESVRRIQCMSEKSSDVNMGNGFEHFIGWETSFSSENFAAMVVVCPILVRILQTHCTLREMDCRELRLGRVVYKIQTKIIYSLF